MRSFRGSCAPDAAASSHRLKAGAQIKKKERKRHTKKTTRKARVYAVSLLNTGFDEDRADLVILSLCSPSSSASLAHRSAMRCHLLLVCANYKQAVLSEEMRRMFVRKSPETTWVDYTIETATIMKYELI